MTPATRRALIDLSHNEELSEELRKAIRREIDRPPPKIPASEWIPKPGAGH